jgi:hypothetical protein
MRKAGAAAVAPDLGPFAEFSPTVNVLGFIECALPVAQRTLEQWRHRIDWKYELRATTAGPMEALRAFEPLCWPFDVEALLETSAGWTAYANNSVRWGTEPAPIGEIALQARSRAVEIALLPHTIARDGSKLLGCYGLTSFTVYAPERTAWVNTSRAVSVSNDGRWKFFEMGDALPFEKLEQYKAKSVRDRLTAADVLSYCGALGIRPYDRAFYAARSVVLRFTGGARTQHANFEQARKDLRFEV